MKTYTFSDGFICKSKLDISEVIKRMKRLDTLRVLVEQHDCEEGRNICNKAIKAYNKQDNFTGIIRLTRLEKDWLAYMLESEFIDDEDIECIRFYTGIKEVA